MRTEFLGSPVDVLTREQTIEQIHQAIHSRTRLQHVALNVAKLVKMQTDPLLRQDVSESDMIGIDGMGIVWGMRLLGTEVPERVSGVDLLDDVLSLCARHGYRPYFLGATTDVVRRAVAMSMQKYPGLQFAGVQDGYFRYEDEEQVVENIRTSGADCLFIGMPTPRKERFLHSYRDKLNVPFIMGVGGSFDVIAGKVLRAPKWVQNAGFEWLYRVYQEPKRMWKRYLTTNLAFAKMLAKAYLAKKKPETGLNRTEPTLTPRVDDRAA